MTSYNGPVRFDIGGQAYGAGQFAIAIGGTMSAYSVTLSGGMLSGYTGASATVSVDVWLDDGRHVRESAPSSVQGIYFSAPLSGFTLPWSSLIGTGLTSYHETYSYSADRSVIYATLAAEFSGYDSGYYLIGTATGSATLSATTSAYSITSAQAQRSEGSGGTTAFTFTVQRQGSRLGSGSVGWSVVGSSANAATAADFADNVMPSGTLFFTAGQASQTLTIQVAADSIVEADEGFTVRVNQNPGEVMITTATATATILNDDVVVLSLEPVLADRSEGAAGGTGFSFRITRTGGAGGGASVGWSVVGSGPTPAQGADFVGGEMPSGVVTFLAGETSRTVTVQVVGDAVAEAHEGFAVVLANPVGAVIEQGVATGLIINDDGGAAGVADSTAADESFAMGDGGDLVRFSAGRAAYRVGVLENRVRVEGPDGADELVDVDWVKFGGEAAITLETLRLQPGTDELMRFLTTGPGGTQVVHALPLAYVGPLALDYVYPGTDFDDVMAGTSRNEFVNLAGGNDAAQMGAGDDVVDGGGGNNFLTGGAGRDAFFLDGRFAMPVWSCITDWEVGETLTLWGWTPGVSVGAWGENAGLPGYLGATFFADIDGSGQVETVVTFAGRGMAELPAPRPMEVSGIGVLQFG